MSGPYEFGDVVDGYRWTVLGWEPVEGSEPAASAALQHALDTHLEQPALTRHARHLFSATLPSATQAAVQPAAAPPASTEPAVPDTMGDAPAEVAAQPAAAITEDVVELPVPAQRDDDPASAALPAGSDAEAAPQLRWTAVGWEVVADEDVPVEPPRTTEAEPTAATEDQGDLDEQPTILGEARPQAEPVEEFADVIAAAPSAPPIEADDAEPSVVDLRADERTIVLPEPAAGWYPG